MASRLNNAPSFASETGHGKGGERIGRPAFAGGQARAAEIEQAWTPDRQNQIARTPKQPANAEGVDRRASARSCDKPNVRFSARRHDSGPTASHPFRPFQAHSQMLSWPARALARSTGAQKPHQTAEQLHETASSSPARCPIQVVAPALVQVVWREGAAVLLQLPGRGLLRAHARMHVALARQLAALLQVAVAARGHDVLPGRPAAAAARDHVVECQLVRRLTGRRNIGS